MNRSATACSVLSATLLAVAAAQEPQLTELEPVVVEGERSEIDSIGGVYRQRLPCVGPCEEAEGEPDAVARVLQGIRALFIASALPEKPTPQDSLGLVNPIQLRLDEKLP